jgi:D-lyxose ketol-isomerase
MRKKIINQPEPQWIAKNWGGERVLDNREEYCCKILNVVRNKRLSVHYHLDKIETFYLLSGKVIIKFFDDYERMLEIIEKEGYDKMTQDVKEKIVELMETIILEPDSTFFCPPGRVHQLIGVYDSKIIEVSTHHKDSDSYRIVKGD